MQDRFSRQVRFAELGPTGQQRLRSARALVVGVGALGSHAAEALVRAGVGTLWLVDRDIVELDNLPRQVLFDEADARAGRPKAIAAAARLGAIDSSCALHAWADDFDAELFARLGGVPDVIVDGTDNFATRYLINDLALAHRVPWIYGGVVGARGSAMAVLPGATACLRCVLPQAAPAAEAGTCETLGVLGPAVAMVAAFQSAQALKILAGRSSDVARGVLEIDIWRDRYALRLGDAGPAPSCPACSGRAYPALASPRREPVRLCGRDAVQVWPAAGGAVDLDALAAALAGVADRIERTPHSLRFAVEGCRFSVFPGGRTLLLGTEDLRRARILYDRYVGGG